MTETARRDVERAIEEIEQRFGSQVLESASQLRAIVSDLVGAIQTDHRDEVRAMAAAAEALHASKESRSEVIARARELADNSEVPWAVDLLADRRGIRLVRDEEPAGRSRLLMVAGLLLVAAVLVVFVVVRLRGGIQPPGPTVTTEAPTTAPPPEYTATFAPVQEASYLVTRVWRAQGESMRVEVTIAPVAGQPAGLHREAIVGSGTVESLVPVPAGTPEEGVVIYGPVEGGPLSFSYRIALDAPASEAELNTLLDEWIPRRDAQISTVDVFAPMPEPQITTS